MSRRGLKFSTKSSSVWMAVALASALVCSLCPVLDSADASPPEKAVDEVLTVPENKTGLPDWIIDAIQKSEKKYEHPTYVLKGCGQVQNSSAFRILFPQSATGGGVKSPPLDGKFYIVGPVATYSLSEDWGIYEGNTRLYLDLNQTVKSGNKDTNNLRLISPISCDKWGNPIQIRFGLFEGKGEKSNLYVSGAANNPLVRISHTLTLGTGDDKEVLSRNYISQNFIPDYAFKRCWAEECNKLKLGRFQHPTPMDHLRNAFAGLRRSSGALLGPAGPMFIQVGGGMGADVAANLGAPSWASEGIGAGGVGLATAYAAYIQSGFVGSFAEWLVIGTGMTLTSPPVLIGGTAVAGLGLGLGLDYCVNGCFSDAAALTAAFAMDSLNSLYRWERDFGTTSSMWGSFGRGGGLWGPAK